MKGRNFLSRAGFAVAGIHVAWQREVSFRTQVMAAAAVIIAAVVLQPPLLWIALLILCIALVLGAELINTSLEVLADGLHPDDAAFVRMAKDCAAAAVLIFSLCSVAVFLLMLHAV